MQPKISKILSDAKKLIANPENWCKMDYAKDKNDNYVKFDSEDACKWCAAGAIKAASYLTNYETLTIQSKCFDYSYRVLCGSNIEYFNDKGSHTDVLNLFDQMIRLAKSEEI